MTFAGVQAVVTLSACIEADRYLWKSGYVGSVLMNRET